MRDEPLPQSEIILYQKGGMQPSLPTIAAPEPDEGVGQRLVEDVAVAVAGGFAEDVAVVVAFGG